MRERIDAACRSAERDPSEVELLAVTKKVSVEVAAALVRLGQPTLGENRAPEFERKVLALEELGLAAHWHFIGTLQRNKVRRVVRAADTIHSIDSVALLESVEKSAAEFDTRPGLYLQVNVSDESEKHGLPINDLPQAVEVCRRSPHVRLLGLMGMGPRMAGAKDSDRRAGARQSFDRVTELGASLDASAFEDGKLRYSMGMSGDLEEAIFAGSHIVRVGTALFDGIEEETR